MADQVRQGTVDRHIVIENAAVQALQKRSALATIIIPFLGTVAAIALLFFHPLGTVDIALFIVMYALTIFGVTAGFHRHFSHGAFKAKPALRVALGILGSMAAQGSPVYFTATHRRHHQFSEGDGDPHSPYLHEGQKLGFWYGLWHSHLGWMLNSKMTNTARYARDLIRDPLIAKVNDLYYVWVALGVLIPAVLGALLTWSWMGGLTGFLWGGMVRLFVVHHLMWTSGSTAHMLGTRPFDTHDRSTNNPVLAYANFGEAYHNNHHAFPYSALFGLHWWQFDLGGWVILLFAKLGWVWDVKFPTREMVEEKRKRAGRAQVELEGAGAGRQ
jgi:stearoyl-CoA desaturase (Delta-9 desaturase)